MERYLVNPLINKKHRGQAIVEIALLLPFVLLFIMGALDLGRVYLTKIVLYNAAEQGAYYLSYNPGDVSCASSVCSPGTGILAAVQNEANKSGVVIPNGNVTILDCTTSPCIAGNPGTVKVNYTIKLNIFRFLGPTLPLSSQVTMIIQ
jgi:Flp pilus assembly protein TadG